MSEVKLKKRGGDNGKRKPIIDEHGEKTCVCTTPKQSSFPEGRFVCIRCWGYWYK